MASFDEMVDEPSPGGGPDGLIGGPAEGLGRDEMNIAEFPITLLTDRAPRGQSRIDHQDTIVDLRTGKEITRRLTITAPEAYGLPTSTDDDVIVALIQLTRRQSNFGRQEVEFTRLKLIETLGWPDKGRSYERVAQSLDRWASTYLKYENAWWDAEGRRWTSGGFHIIDGYALGDGRLGSADGGPDRCRVTWGREFFRSCQVGYLKGLDYELYLRLTLHTSRRMYRFLDKRFYHKPDWTFELRDFAVEHIGLSRSYRDAGKVKEKLRPGIEELEGVGYIEPLPRDERFRREAGGWTIRLSRRRPPAEAPEPPAGPLEAALAARGVTPSTAAELARQHPPATIAERLDVFDWLVDRGDKRVGLNPAGYLVESIRQGYAAPKGYEPRAARDRARAEAEAGRARLEEARRRSAAEAGRERDDREAADRYWGALGPAERDRLDAEALAARPPTPGVLASPLRAAYVREVRAEFIRDLLAARAATE